VGCVLRARHGVATCGPDVHGERSPPDHLLPAASQPTGPPGPPHHQDYGLPLQVPLERKEKKRKEKKRKEKKRKEKKRKDYAFWCQFNEKPSIILGCSGPGATTCPVSHVESMMTLTGSMRQHADG